LPNSWRRWPQPAKIKLRDELLAELARINGASGSNPLQSADLPWRDWLDRYFPHVARCQPAERMERLWEWFEALTPGVSPRPRVEVWPRGGAKSSSAELGTVRVGAKLSRRFVLYCCGTQAQADLHVQAISALFERLGVARAVNRYGASKGWRRDQLRTANGFNVAAFGLDTGSRGVRIEEYRPDLLIFDDVDDRLDSPETVEKKVATITQSILPTGSSDAAVLVVQNLIHADGVVAQLVDGTADFLHSREVPTVEPAIRGLEVVSEPQDGGGNRYRITAGEPTWEGQDRATCERQINEWGLRAFLREAQHEVHAEGDFFREAWFPIVASAPEGCRKLRAWDKAATLGGGDWTAGVLWGVCDGIYYVLDVVRGQWDPDERNRIMRQTAVRDGLRVPAWIEAEGGSSGKDAALADVRNLRDPSEGFSGGFTVSTEHPTGEKSVRAEPLQEEAAAGNVRVVRGAWNRAFIRELCAFPNGRNDDQVDAASLGFNKISRPRQRWTVH
jgi:predicted phage terminase large subunit-like protein